MLTHKKPKKREEEIETRREGLINGNAIEQPLLRDDIRSAISIAETAKLAG